MANPTVGDDDDVYGPLDNSPAFDLVQAVRDRVTATAACETCGRPMAEHPMTEDGPSCLEPATAAPDWHALYVDAMAKFTAETRTTSYLVGLLREAQTLCQRCGGRTGSAVLAVGDERTFVCDICVARTPAFTERLATRMREDKPILDRLADRPIRVKDTSKFPPRERT